MSAPSLIPFVLTIITVGQMTSVSRAGTVTSSSTVTSSTVTSPAATTTMTSSATTPRSVDVSGFQVNLDELQKLGITSDDLLRHIRLLFDGNYRCTLIHSQHRSGGTQDEEMRRYYVRNRTVTCNDGSQPGYYIRKAHQNSRRWMIFLEGGWLCFDQKSCHGRWINTPHLMSSNHWTQTKRGSGILSTDPRENPFIHDGNIVYVPYCSSDCWSGTYKARSRGDFSFMGALILPEVIKDLIHLHGLATATKLYLAGTSAGATGVLLNLDRVADIVHRLAPSVEVRGISDSGWFLDNKQYKPVGCSDALQCAPTDSVRKGMILWHGLVPDNCRNFYAPGEQWRCYFGYRIYSTLRTVVFVVQNLFDEAQITLDNVGPPIRRQQWKYIHDLGQDMKHTLVNVSAVFAPACLSHMLITRSEWRKVTIDGVSLPEALKCWESGRQEKNRYEIPSNADRGQAYMSSSEPNFITNGSWRKREKLQSDDPKLANRRQRNERREEPQRHKKRHRKDQKDRRNPSSKRHRLNRLPHGIRLAQRGNQKTNHRPQPPPPPPPRHANSSFSSDDVEEDHLVVVPPPPPPPHRGRRSSLFFDLHDIHRVQQHENQCHHHRLDQCAWPQCNPACPKVRNPFTGDEMDFVDLLVHFGLDLSNVALSLGKDLATVQNMDHGQLLRMLMQNSSK